MFEEVVRVHALQRHLCHHAQCAQPHLGHFEQIGVRGGRQLERAKGRGGELHAYHLHVHRRNRRASPVRSHLRHGGGVAVLSVLSVAVVVVMVMVVGSRGGSDSDSAGGGHWRNWCDRRDWRDWCVVHVILSHLDETANLLLGDGGEVLKREPHGP